MVEFWLDAKALFTVGKLIPLLIFIAAGLFFLNPSAFTLGAAPSTGAFSQSVLLLIYAFTGFEMAAIPAGETKDPRRDLPRALLIAIGVVAVVYVLIQVVSIGTLPGLANSTKPLADAGQQFLGTAGGALISAGAIISITGNLNIILLSGSRVPFAIAEQKQLPRFVGIIHRRFSTPHVSILITAAIMFVLTLNSSFVAALTISAIARLVTYAATCLALPVLRQKKDVPEAVFRVRGGTIIAIACLILIVWLLLNSTLYEAIVAAIAAAVGFVIYLAYWFYRKKLRETADGHR
jgi:amino acid transporter